MSLFTLSLHPGNVQCSISNRQLFFLDLDRAIDAPTEEDQSLARIVASDTGYSLPNLPFKTIVLMTFNPSKLCRTFGPSRTDMSLPDP